MGIENNAVQKAGRIEYIEPNNLFISSEGDKIQNGIPQPYEDYSFSVNLRVINGNRYDCGQTGEAGRNSRNVLEFSSDHGTLSFMDGTVSNGQAYLTTNFTDISMNDPSTNTKECLGIEHISIRYDSWYYPTVDIKFVDVRGASLMQPSEYEYYNNGGPNIGKPGKGVPTSHSDFFRAFFSFPYPLFKLSVKGFYGKEVTYDLSVLKCNIELNSSTGNFEMNASFIGYMYGMYADLPFPFVYIAPYINLYGKDTWDEKKGSGDFCYLDNDAEGGKSIQMYTFPELREKVRNASTQATKDIAESAPGKKKAILEKLINKLEQSALFKYPFTAGKYKWWSWSKTNTEQDMSGYYFISLDDSDENNRLIFNDLLSFAVGFNEYSELTEEADKINKEIESDSGDGTKIESEYKVKSKPIFVNLYNEAKELKTTEKKDPKVVSSEYTNEEIKKLLSDKVATLRFRKTGEKEKATLVFDKSNSTFANKGESEFSDLINELFDRFKNDEVASPIKRDLAEKEWTIKAIKFSDICYREGISTTLTGMKSEFGKLLADIDKLRDQKIVDAVGFKPYVKNMFNMVFAHIDTFMSAYYNVLDRIRQKIQGEDTTRKYDRLCGDEIQVDVSDNTLKSASSNGGKLPPFPMFYKEQQKKDSKDREVVMLWPGEIEGGQDLDEVQFVEAIINATSLSRRGFDSVTPKDNVAGKEGILAPITYYDIIRKDWNPYLEVLNDKALGDPETAKRVAEVFMFRCFYSMLFGGYIRSDVGKSDFTEKAKLVAKIEVENVKRAFEALSESPKDKFLKGLMMLPEKGSEFVNRYIGEGSKYFTVDGAGSMIYDWIQIGGNAILPVGLFDMGKLSEFSKSKTIGGNYDKFLKIAGLTGSTNVNSLYACRLYAGGRKIEDALSKYSSGDFVESSRLFPNYDTLPSSLSGIKFANGTFSYEEPRDEFTIDDLYSNNSGYIDAYPDFPSVRKTANGTTSVFMDPLYYAQKTKEARAYMFLMGIPFGEDGKYILPKTFDNGDYPTLLLLREGAYYWRNNGIVAYTMDDSTKYTFLNDPITYEYFDGSTKKNTLDEVEKYDPRFGRNAAIEVYKTEEENVSAGRKETLINYFIKWVNVAGAEYEPGDFSPLYVSAKTNVDIEIPTPSLLFGEIERYLGLWEKKGETSRILSPENCQMAVSAPTVDSFSNGEILRGVYNVGEDRKLGKVGKIRTDVYIKSAGIGSDTISKFLLSFKKFYVGFDTIIDFSHLGPSSNSASVPSDVMNVAVTAFIAGLKDANGVSDGKIKEGNGVNTSGRAKPAPNVLSQFNSKDFKLACYIALKNMYDRWLCNSSRKNWYFSCKKDRLASIYRSGRVKSDFERFFYINEFYQDIGLGTLINLTNFAEMACDFGGFTEKTNETNLASVSIMKVLSTTAQYGHCALLTLPTSLGLANTYSSQNNSIADVFKAFTYNEATKTDTIETSFIVLYSNQKSSVLNTEDDKGDMGYKTDGFDIANTWGEIIPQPMFADNSDGGYVVPCFGVTFAKQNQSYFKDIRLSMEDHQVTEYSIKNEIMISYQSNKGPKESVILGQDLYSVFSNYSYSCTVSMLGDSQITPLMYFQLNNIPMWKGAYLITNVHHDISYQGMETQFTGVRQSRPSLPTKEDEISNPKDPATRMTEYSQEDVTTANPKDENLNISERPLDRVSADNVASVIFTIDRNSVTRTNNGSWLNGLLSISVYDYDGQLTTYPNTAITKEIIGESSAFDELAINVGRFDRVYISNASENDEYRDANDTFYKFTDGGHIVIWDKNFGSKFREIIIGDDGVEYKSIGSLLPVMIFSNSENRSTKEDTKPLYAELFRFINRMMKAQIPMSLLITESSNPWDNEIDG